MPNRPEIFSARIRLTDSVRPSTPTTLYLNYQSPNSTLFVRAQSSPARRTSRCAHLVVRVTAWGTLQGSFGAIFSTYHPQANHARLGGSPDRVIVPMPTHLDSVSHQDTHRMTSTAQNGHMAFSPHYLSPISGTPHYLCLINRSPPPSTPSVRDSQLCGITASGGNVNAGWRMSRDVPSQSFSIFGSTWPLGR